MMNYLDYSKDKFNEDKELEENEFIIEGMEEEDEDGKVEVDSGVSKVATSKGKNIVIVIAALLVSLFFVYKFVFLGNEKTQEQIKQEQEKELIEQQKQKEVVKPVPETKEQVKQDNFFEAPKIENDLSGLSPPSLEKESSLLPPIVDNSNNEIPQNNIEQKVPAMNNELPPVNQPPVAALPLDNLGQNNAQMPINSYLVGPEPPLGFYENNNASSLEGGATGPTQEELMSRKRAKRTVSMLSLGGGGGDKAQNSKKVTAGLGQTSAARVVNTKIGNPNMLIAQGKIINAVLETAINTDLPGTLRALVSRDVYAEAGNKILIPKGSRLIGVYANNIEKGQVRVAISWTRVIMPGGTDLMIDSQATDQLGVSGLGGKVDNKYAEIFGNSILLSVLTITGASLIDKINKTGSTTSTTSTGINGDTSTSQSGSPTDFAISDSISNIADVAKTVVGGFAEAKPTITVAQGTRITVFVNQDLMFPSSGAQIIH